MCAVFSENELIDTSDQCFVSFSPKKEMIYIGNIYFLIICSMCNI